MTDDIELLRRYAETSSEEAFAELVRRHVGFVYAAALRQARNPHRAEDVTQIVFTGLARKAAALCRRKDLVGWLYLSVHYAATDVVRKEARREARERESQMIHEAADNPSVAVDWEKLDPVLDAVLRDLGEADRSAVLLRYFKNCSFAETGAALRVTEEAARKRVDRALEKMRSLLARRGITSTTTALTFALANQGAVAAPAGLAATVTGAALAVGPAAGLSVTAALGVFMNAAKSLTGVAVILALLATGSLISDTLALRAAERRAAAATIAAEAESARALGRSERLNRQANALEDRITQLEASRSVMAAPPVVDLARPYLSDPVYRELYRTSKLARLHFDFQRFYRMIGLSPENIERFEATMVRQDMSNLDAMIARDTGGDEKAVNLGSAKEWNASMDELLGPEGKKLLEDYLKTTSVRNLFDGLATGGFPTGAPITAAQSDQLYQLALVNDPVYQGGKGTDESNINWEAMWEPAAKILSPDQLANLQTAAEVVTLRKRIQSGLAAAAK
ncbi:MAG TPA: sigma-70 family RNA polymerase sigma factor [Opitutaceae bacterium]|nr:sigma-70 family RNA polymerase sigma factor [Opitutaceae bacterium]